MIDKKVIEKRIVKILRKEQLSIYDIIKKIKAENGFDTEEISKLDYNLFYNLIRKMVMDGKLVVVREEKSERGNFTKKIMGLKEV